MDHYIKIQPEGKKSPKKIWDKKYGSRTVVPRKFRRSPQQGTNKQK